MRKLIVMIVAVAVFGGPLAPSHGRQAAPLAPAVAPAPVVTVPVAVVLSSPPVYVETYASAYYWPVGGALSFVDGYTSSQFVRGWCRAGYKCIRIYERTIKSDWGAVTYLWSWGAQIYVNPQRRSQPYSYRIRYLVHETAHTRYVLEHTYGCTDIMHWRVPCWGTTLPPLRFSYSQRLTLWRY